MTAAPADAGCPGGMSTIMSSSADCASTRISPFERSYTSRRILFWMIWTFAGLKYAVFRGVATTLPRIASSTSEAAVVVRYPNWAW